EILKRGGRRDRLEVKLFGGGNVIESSALIGDRNAQFVREYLTREGFKIAAEDLGGKHPRRIHYFTDTGKVKMRKLMRRSDDESVIKHERDYAKQIAKAPVEGDIELFD